MSDQPQTTLTVTAQSTTGIRAVVPLKVIQFSAGEVQPRIEQTPISDIEKLEFRLHFRSMGDLFTLGLAVDAFRRHPLTRNAVFSAIIPYFPGARQDRVCYPGEPLTARVLADFVNAMRFDAVTVWDAHSDVLGAVLDRCIHVPASHWAKSLPKHAVVVAPDKGAKGRAAAFSWAHHAKITAQADKVRDSSSGEIKGIALETDLSGFGDADFLMVDDISDGGRTFIELAKVLRPMTAGKIDLFVTHLIGAGGFDKFRGVIDTIYTPNCFVTDAPADLVYTLS
jgi:ribose-phosphate pyrophosphokinase